MNIGLTLPSRNTKSCWVHVGDLDVLFSYTTPVAFSACGDHRYRRHNIWGPTTGRHLRENNVNDWTPLEGAEFNQKLDAFFVEQITRDVTRTLEGAAA